LNPKDAPVGSIEISSYDGVKAAADSFSLRVDAEYIGSGDFDSAAKKLADGKHPIIVVVGADLTAATRKAASTYPFVKFVGVNQQSDEALLSNLSVVISRSDEEGFIAGMIGGYLTKSRVVAVMVPNNNNFEAKRYTNGFTQGVRYSCGICQTIVVQIDVEKENGAEAITRLQRQKTDVLLPALNHTLGADVTKLGATTGGLWVIGVGRDYGVTLNDGNRIAVSILRKPDEVIVQLIKTLMSGGPAKVMTLSATNNGLRLSPKFASEISPAAIRLMKDSFDLLASGLLDVGVDFATGDVK
jgi:basic membrane lipoprotein Med (substrate-binding protein (PBP1-ABC) superfamily)